MNNTSSYTDIFNEEDFVLLLETKSDLDGIQKVPDHTFFDKVNFDLEDFQEGKLLDNANNVLRNVKNPVLVFNTMKEIQGNGPDTSTLGPNFEVRTY